MNTATASSSEIRGRILAAADHRFRRFGYTKTTMAEIAKDCGMSAANLYRYFESKQDIAAAFACLCLSEVEIKLKKIIDLKGVNAAQRLESFVLALLDHTYSQWSEQPRLNELVEAVTRERTDLVWKHVHTKHSLLVELIARGKESGEFKEVDTQSAAEAALAAFALFDTPFLMHLFSLEELQRKAKLVAHVLLEGLAAD